MPPPRRPCRERARDITARDDPSRRARARRDRQSDRPSDRPSPEGTPPNSNLRKGNQADEAVQPEAEPVEGLLRQGLSALVAGGGPGGLVSGGVGAHDFFERIRPRAAPSSPAPAKPQAKDHTVLAEAAFKELRCEWLAAMSHAM